MLLQILDFLFHIYDVVVKMRYMYYVVLGWSVWLSKTVPLHWNKILYLCTINRKVTVYDRSRSFSLWEVKVIDIMSLTNCQSICDFQFAFHFRADLLIRKIYGLCEKQVLFCSYKLMCGLLFSNVSHTHQCRDTIEILTFIGIFERSEFLYSNDLTGS